MKGAGDNIAGPRRPSLAIRIPSGASLPVSDGGPFGGSILQAIPPSGDESDNESPIYTPTSSSDGDGYEEYLATQSTSPPAPPLHPLQRGHGRVCVSNAIVGPNSVQIIRSGIGHSQFLVKTTSGRRIRRAFWDGAIERPVVQRLERVADPNDGENVDSALLCAIERYQKEVVFALLERGADPNARGSKGSALTLAIERYQKEVVFALLERGADPNARGSKGSALTLRATPGGYGIQAARTRC